MGKIQLVKQALDSVLGTQIGSLSVIEQFFSRDYIQIVDGKEIGFDEFVAHMKVLEEATESITITIKSIAEGDNCVHTQHIAKAMKKDGSYSEYEVFACFTILDNKIVRCEELTRMTQGNKHDSDLGSRT
ncbi:nuclear transport factor 2 family protein [Providencia rettgeri]|uniref:nuclear transport factor 2 family protein n=1 Tax=Providencia rettgeri TaxID=587 RepID=UPI00384B5632